MKMQYFIKRYHKKTSIFILEHIILSAVTIFILLGYHPYFFISIAIMIMMSVLILKAVEFVSKSGIYVTEDKIYDKGFKLKEINIEEIVAIKPVRVSSTQYFETYLKDENGEYVHRLLFLRYTDRTIEPCIVEESVWIEDRNCIIFSCEYDEDMIEYVKGRKPDVIVLPKP